LGAYVVEFVDDSFDIGIFVEYDGCDEAFVWEVILLEVEVGYPALMAARHFGPRLSYLRGL